MRKALWSTAALVALLSGAMLTWGTDALAATSTVTMGSDAEPNAFKFFPAELSIPVGSTVQWESKSDLPHDAVSEGNFKSKKLQKGDKFEFTFSTPGVFNYICTEPGHEDAGMKGVITVTGGSTPAPTTATTAPTTTTSAGQSTTTTTTKAADGGSTTTTTAAGAVTTATTSPSATTPSSAPESSATDGSATSDGGGESAAADDHGSQEAESAEAEKDDQENDPIGIAFAGISTVLLAAITGKLLASKS